MIWLNFKQWNGSSPGWKRVMLSKWLLPRIYPNGYRWTPFVVIRWSRLFQKPIELVED